MDRRRVRIYAKRALRTLSDEGADALVTKTVRRIQNDILPWIRIQIQRIQYRMLGETWFIRYALWRNMQSEWDALADPFKTIHVDPHTIEYRVPQHPTLRWRRMGQVVSGNWDRTDERVWDTLGYVYETLYARFIEDYEWRDIAFVRDCLAGRETWRGESGPAVLERCRKLDALYEDLRTEGYKDQREIHGIDSYEEVCRSEVSIRDWLDHVTVAIGRDGTVLYQDGKHRLALAQLLGFESIPVSVVFRHREWQLVREEVAAADDPTYLSARSKRHLDHPDLADVRSFDDFED